MLFLSQDRQRGEVFLRADRPDRPHLEDAAAPGLDAQAAAAERRQRQDVRDRDRDAGRQLQTVAVQVQPAGADPPVAAAHVVDLVAAVLEDRAVASLSAVQTDALLLPGGPLARVLKGHAAAAEAAAERIDRGEAAGAAEEFVVAALHRAEVAAFGAEAEQLFQALGRALAAVGRGALADGSEGVFVQVLFDQRLQLVGLHGLQHAGAEAPPQLRPDASAARDAVGPARRGEVGALQPQHDQSEAAGLDPFCEVGRDRAGLAVRAAPPLGEEAEAAAACAGLGKRGLGRSLLRKQPFIFRLHCKKAFF